MLIGLAMIFVPIIVFIVTLPYSSRLGPSLRLVYRIVGAMIVFIGGAVTVYLASYTGDQGSIAAYYFQIGVISVYTALSVSIVVLNSLRRTAGSRKSPR